MVEQTRSPRSEMKRAKWTFWPGMWSNRWESSLLVVLAVEIVAFSLTADGFFGQFTGLLSLTESFLPIGFVALGISIVILTGGIDLSVGAIASLSAVTMGVLWQHHINIWVAMLISFVIGIGLGAMNGLLIVKVKIEPLIATLATSFIYESLATAISGNSPPYGFPNGFGALGAGTIGPIPYQLVAFSVAAAIVVWVMKRTSFGRSIVMIGYNAAAAQYSGIKVGRQLTIAYTISGFSAAVAGALLGAYFQAVRPDMGNTLLLPAITMAVLGGIDIFGGDGNVVGTIISVFLLGFLEQGLLIMGYSSMVSTMVTGGVLLVALFLKISLSDAEKRQRMKSWFRAKTKHSKNYN